MLLSRANVASILGDAQEQAKVWYGKTTNTTGTPLIKHALDVTFILFTALKNENLSEKKLKSLLLAALGHDLLEDTGTTPEAIGTLWGSEALSYIQELTNAKGDKDFSDYISTLSHSSEEVLLIKFSDIAANLQNTMKHFESIDHNWIQTFWLPLLKQYEQQLFTVSFRKYSQIAQKLTETISNDVHFLEQRAAPSSEN